jgi:hypothetical protein
MQGNKTKYKEKQTVPKKKKYKRIISRLLVTLLIIVILPPIIISFPFVQTCIVKQISGQLSEQLQTRISVESVNISFFNRVRIKGIYVEDLDNDTLMYVSRMDATIGNLPLNGRPLKLNKLKLADGIFCLRGDSLDTNVSLFIDKLRNKNEQSTDTISVEDDVMANTFRFTTKSLELRNFRYVMQLDGAPSTEEQPDGIIYKNMSITEINLDADRISIVNDSLTFRVNEFSFKERSGLNIHRMIADTGIIRFGKEVTLRELRIIDDFSDIRMRNMSMSYDGGDDFNDFINKVNFAVDVYDSNIDFASLGYFAPELNIFPVTANFEGQISGHIADLRSDNFKLQTLSKTMINGRFSIFGLPDIENTMIFLDLKHLDTNPDDIAQVVKSLTGQDFGEKEVLDAFGNLHFHGTYTGLVSDFVAYGYLKSELGVLEMDILFNNQKNSIKFSGELAAKKFNAGALINSPLIGATEFNMTMNGTILGDKNDIFGKGNISMLELNNYKYHNVELEGRLFGQSFDGEVKISEPNLDLDFIGNIDLSGENNIPVFNFNADLKRADLVKLNINKRDSVSVVSADINANFMASSILDYVGQLTVERLTYSDSRGKMNFGTVGLLSYNGENGNYLELESGFVDAKYFGQNGLGNFVENLQYIIQEHVPNLFPEKTKTRPRSPNLEYDFRASIKDAKDIARIFLPELYVEKNTKLDIIINTDNRLNVNITSDKISYNDNQISNFRLRCNNDSDSLVARLSGNLITDWATIKDFRLDNAIFNDAIRTRFSFYDSVNNSDANIYFATQLSRNPESRNSLIIDVDVDESNLTFFGQTWDLSPTFLRINGDKFSINGFKIHKSGQKIEVSGTVSQNPNDSLKISMTNYRLKALNHYLSPFGYMVEGKISGEMDLYGLYDTAYIISSIYFDTLIINHDTIGNVAIGSMWNNHKKCIDIASRISFNDSLYSSIYGYIFPTSKEIGAEVNIKNFKIKIIEPLLADIVSNISGMLNGTVNIKGTLTNPDFSGKLYLDNVGLTIDYLQTHYALNSSLDITGSAINMTNGQIKDAEGNTGELNMNMTHNYFRNIQLNASARVENFLSLNTKSKDNPLFYGTAYTSGFVNLTGNPDLLNLAITAETKSNTVFFIPISSTSEVKESDFLTFDRSVTDLSDDESEKSSEAAYRDNSKMTLGFDLAVTPQSEIQILIDPKVGDILRARGSGNLKIFVDPALELFNITGDYLIEEGDYNFTLPNFSIVSRKFTINRGSRIRFKGDIESSELNVTASYKERVALATLFPDDSLRNHPVECQIFITGQMTNPLLKFNIDIHDIDPEKKAQFANLVNTDEKMTRQFLSLLVLRMFLPEQNFATQDLGSTTLMYNASDLLSGQIGNLISMFNLPIPLDVNVDYNSNMHTNMGAGFGIDVSAQLFDRVILNGSASNKTTSNRSFIGDVEMEVLLGKNQNTRFKVFSKSRDYFSDDMESNRNGIALSYRSQFDRFIEIFRRRKKKEK